MEIQLPDSVPEEAPNYKHIWVKSRSITQKRPNHRSDKPEYEVDISYKRYSIEQGGSFLFEPKTHRIHFTSVGISKDINLSKTNVANLIRDHHGRNTQVI